MEENLDDIFESYDEKKSQEKQAADQKAEKERVERDATKTLIESVVLPSVKEIVSQVLTKGHKATFEERFANYAYPHVVIEFTPVPKVKDQHGGGYIPSSKMTFIHADGGGIKVTKKVNSNSDRNHYAVPSDDYIAKPEQVTPEWARNQILVFIQAVLNAN